MRAGTIEYIIIAMIDSLQHQHQHIGISIGQARSEEKKRKEKGGARAPRIFGFSASDTGWMSFYFNF